jgi:DNA recombination protein RmuC
MDPMLLVALAAILVAGIAIVYAIRSRTPAAPAAASRDQINDTVRAAAAEALRANSEQFMQLARTELEKAQLEASGDLEKRERAIAELVKPIQDGLSAYQEKLAHIETERTRTFGELTQHLRTLGEANSSLRRETQALTESLKSPTVRGRWGEVALRNVVELAGMTERCDFEEQSAIQGTDGRLRPDMIVRLPGGRSIAVDAKVPLAAYIESANSTDESLRANLLIAHARAVREHAKALGRKEYWAQFDRSPEFVVMFLPGEVFYAAALQSDPTLLESVIGERVIIASPTSLIALLKAAAYGWQQEAIAQSAAEVQKIGRELYDRLATFTGHLSSVGTALERAMRTYNSAVGSLDTRVLVSARKMRELAEWAAPEIEAVDQIEVSPRLLESVEPEMPEITPKPPELPS